MAVKTKKKTRDQELIDQLKNEVVKYINENAELRQTIRGLNFKIQVDHYSVNLDFATKCEARVNEVIYPKIKQLMKYYPETRAFILDNFENIEGE
jgi:hypothetical protein